MPKRDNNDMINVSNMFDDDANDQINNNKLLNINKKINDTSKEQHINEQLLNIKRGQPSNKTNDINNDNELIDFRRLETEILGKNAVVEENELAAKKKRRVEALAAKKEQEQIENDNAMDVDDDEKADNTNNNINNNEQDDNNNDEKKSKEQNFDSVTNTNKDDNKNKKETVDNPLEEEELTGIAAALKRIKSRGIIQQSIEDVAVGRATDKTIEEEFGKDEAPHIRIEHRDEFGNLLKPKEAFRYLSYSFHGHRPSKRAQEKRRRMIEMQTKRKLEDSTMTKAQRLNDTKKKLGKHYVVLDG